jgi:RNA recognition motif-containing protein
VNSCRVAIDKVTSFHKGVAYVDFASNEDAKNAVKYMDGGNLSSVLIQHMHH